MKNACIVGFGAIGPVHAKAICELDDINLYAICDINKEKLDIASKKYDIVKYTDFYEALKDDNIDVMHICTPHYLHVKMTIDAIKAGKDVVLEKPIALNNKELELLIKAYKKYGKKVCVMFQNRYNAAFRKMLEMKKSDKSLGKFLGAFANMRWQRDEKYYSQDVWRGKWDTEGGGVLINQSVHLLDMLLLCTDAPKSLAATMSAKLLKDVIEVEDNFDAIFEFEDDFKAAFYVTNNYAYSVPFFLELNFENATLRYADNVLYKFTKNPADCSVICADNTNSPGKAVWGTGHKMVIDDFYKHLEGKNNSYLTLEDAYLTTNIMHKMYKSAKNNGEKTDV